MTGPCDCRHCTAPSPAAVETAEPEPIGLPDEPTLIRVHTADMAPMDCTLHPDGTLTAMFGGELRRNFVTFADMRETNWRHARIELNPRPLPDETEPESQPQLTQDAIPLDT